ncbi:MAG: SpoIIE family protein phosphatase [Bacteroidia bacterium]
MRIRHYHILIILSLVLSGMGGLSAQAKREGYHVSLPSGPDAKFELTGLFLFHAGDDLSWSAIDFDDSQWDSLSSELRFENDKPGDFRGIGWFRTSLYTDSATRNTPLSIVMDQKGASEIYVDGILIHKLGTVSADEKTEERYTPAFTPLSFPDLKPGKHLIAIRYSNTAYLRQYHYYTSNEPGFRMTIIGLDSAVINYAYFKMTSISVALILGIFFFTLGFVHLLFFLFYRKQRTNLQYAVFVFLFGSLFISFTISNNTFNPDLSALLDHYLPFVFVLFFFAMLRLHYGLFRAGSKKYLRFMVLFLIITCALMIWKINYTTMTFLFSFIVSTVIPSFFIVIKSIRRKLDGAWIIGSGSLSFLILLVVIIFKLMFFGQNLHIEGLFLVTMVVIAMVSIPVSMSIYLARDFARTNNQLEAKLTEVETLSARSIEQEKEKQKMLATQNEMLEVQVTERTYEISEQKKLIEEKNKDITDSISYAKRIQEAILPEQNLLSNLFPDSFILFKPKDIVSGDFYWFAEIGSKKILVSADCTGHGVPGALMSMIGCNILNKLVLEQNIFQPNEILNHLHEEVRAALKQTDKTSDTRDGMDIAIICIEGRTLQYSAAQRPLYHLREGNLEEIKGDKYPVGGIQTEEKRVFTNHILPLQKEDVIYLSSDGFADQFGGAQGKKLMTRHFKELLLRIRDQKMQEQRLQLDHAIETWKGSREQVDDILVIGVRIE